VSISALIVNYNSWDDTIRILKKLPPEIETIVVDNASRERRIIEASRVIFNERNLGFAAALNIGIEASSGEFIAIITPDVDFEPEVIYELSEFLKNHPEVALVVPAAYTPSGKIWPMARMVSNPLSFFLCGRRSPLSSLSGKCREKFTYESLNEPSEIEAAVGTFMLIRKRAWEDVGGFDSSLFFYTEDLDISIRLRKRGWKIYILPHIRIIHNVGKIRKAHSFFAESRRTQSFYRFFTKHYRSMRILKPILFAGAFLHIAQMGLKYLLGIPPRDPHW